MTTKLSIVVYPVLFFTLVMTICHQRYQYHFLPGPFIERKLNWPALTSAQLYRILRHQDSRIKPEDIFLLDTRKSSDYRNSHLPNSSHIFWLNLNKSKNLNKLPRDKIIIMIGPVTDQILLKLQQQHYQFYLVEFNDWINHQYPVVTLSD